MISAELFVLLKLFTTNQVSWWWVIGFILSDWGMWYSLKEAIRRGK